MSVKLVGEKAAERVGGRRGGRISRGGARGSRGSVGHDTGGDPYSHGRGRGRGRGRTGRATGGRSYPSYGIHSSQSSEAYPSRHPRPSVPTLAWCDVCRVDCNSLEILEQHKNGKRHKKTLKSLQDMQARQKHVSAYLDVQELGATETIETSQGPTPGFEADQSAVVPEVDQNTASVAVLVDNVTEPEDLDEKGKAQTESADTEIPAEADLTTVLASEEAVAEPEVAKKEGVLNKKSFGSKSKYEKRILQKRKIPSFGRGGKRPRPFQPAFQPFTPFHQAQNRAFPPADRPRGPREQPRVCTLCDITCDTQAVFEIHLAGKKHMSKISKFHGQGTVFGPLSGYVPPRQPTARPRPGPEPLYYGLSSHEIIQRDVYGGNNNLPLQFSGHPYGGQQLVQPTQYVEQPQQPIGFQYPTMEVQGMVVSAPVSQHGFALEHVDPTGSGFTLPGLDLTNAGQQPFAAAAGAVQGGHIVPS